MPTAPEPPRRDPTLSAFSQRKLGRYELLTQIGKGGMAEVHLAMQRGPGGFEKLVVIKLIHEHLATQKTFVDMLLDEGRLAGMIKHPNVIDIYDLGEADGRYYVAMEYLDGEPLLGILRRGVEGERLDPLSTARVIADTAEGLEAAHRLKSLDGKPLGLIHHDVSLGNIVVLYNGQVKLVDFGVAKARTGGRQELVQGKFGYMAPEKLREDVEVDRRSDIWSLGVVAWEALTLQRLFKANSDRETMEMVLELEIPPPSKVNKDVSPELDPIIMRALERDPEKRVSTAKGLSLDLESVLRKKGYAGKNDRIASYMERSFADQIKVREKLVAELGAGGTSKESLAAFQRAATNAAPGTPGVIEPEVSDGLPSHPDLRAEAAAATSTDRDDPSVARRRESIRDLQDWVDDERRWRSLPWWQRYAPYMAGGAVLLLLAILIVRCNSSPSSEPKVAMIADASTDTTSATRVGFSGADPSDTAAGSAGTHDSGDHAGSDHAGSDHAGSAGSEHAAGDHAGSDGSSHAGTGVGAGSDAGSAADMTPPDKTTRPPDKTTRPPDKTTRPPDKTARSPDKTTRPPDNTATSPKALTAEGMTRVGMDQLRRNDGGGALSSFLQATKLNPSYAPGWYGLGRAYEATGTRRGPTKSAYLRYLSLAPTGQYATDAHARIEGL